MSSEALKSLSPRINRLLDERDGIKGCIAELYGIVLSKFDVRDLAKRIAYHGLIWGDRILWVVYRSRAHGSTRRHGTMITIMPPAVGGDRRQRDHSHMPRRKHAARRP